MESLVDIVTTGFQAVLAVAIVFTAGYVLNSSQDAAFAKVSLTVFGINLECANEQSIATTARSLLLPALIFTTLATTSMSWRTLLMRECGRQGGDPELTYRMAIRDNRFDDPSDFVGVWLDLLEVEQRSDLDSGVSDDQQVSHIQSYECMR